MTMTLNKFVKQGIGRQPSIVSKFQEIIDEVAEFIKQHGFAAQSSCPMKLLILQVS